MLYINHIHQNGTFTTGGVAYALVKELPIDVEVAFAASTLIIDSVWPVQRVKLPANTQLAQCLLF